jgi:hypothetical protein
MIRLGMILAAAAAAAAAVAGGKAHAKMAMQTFPVLAGGTHDVYPAPTVQSGSRRNPPANSAGSIPGPASRI